MLPGKVLPETLKEHMPTMFADLPAYGSILTMAAVFASSASSPLHLVDPMPALIIVMSFSMLWTVLMG